ncbi:lysylphosphatidylglycerol synthase transmembrane domain-containing protein [Halomonas sp. GD1P12]|uniref:lysylphosphatidylglycerol synthase transmembrane domain-containing protein n=1 Tax=Halomonas sp. GD1P12 TaxID=2982691 RepID=UPI0021E3DC1B|nr:lysylphosphatidylglycerol synthase transmembrane domain-containing protein [Halomonas sp. GD1P12]UYG00939.1 flippase-like domain-containing protein [Halomonas sp. GD1P12]
MSIPALSAAKPARRLHALPVVLLLAAVVAPLVLVLLAGGREALLYARAFPTSLLGLMVVIAAVCWNINALRLRLMLGIGTLNQRSALGIELAAKFALCATPGGSGGPVTLLALLSRRGVPPAKGTAVFLIDQGCDSLFFLSMLGLAVAASLIGETRWPHQGLIEAALLGLGVLFTLFVFVILYLPRLLRLRPKARPQAVRRRWLARRLLRGRRALAMTLRLPKPTLAAILLLTALHWVLRYSLLFIAVIGVGGQADWLWTFLIQMLAMAASQLSFLPGGAGAAELGVGTLLLPLMAQEQVAAAVLVWRLVSYHLYLGVGAPVFLLLGARWLKRV